MDDPPVDRETTLEKAQMKRFAQDLEEGLGWVSMVLTDERGGNRESDAGAR